MIRIALNAWFWDNPSVGSGQYLKYLAPALLEIDDNLEIILVSPKPFKTKPETKPRLKFHVAPTPFPNQTSNLAKVWFEQITFPRACQRLGVDVAHVPYFGSSLSPTVPTVVTVHDLIPMMLPEYRGNALVRLYTSLVAAAAPQADLILADSGASKRDILQKLKAPDEQVRVVYLAPAPHFQPAETWPQIIEIKKKYNLPENFVLYLGGYDVRKNVSALLHAYTWVSATLGDEYPLVLAGRLPEKDTSFFPDPLRIARELGIEEYIITPGWIAEEDRPLVYAAATVFVFPSRYEGFGLPVLEAMACGTPVVTTNAASLPEVAGGAAWLVSPDDEAQLIEAMRRALCDQTLREEMTTKGRAHATTFTWDRTARQTADVYKRALAPEEVRIRE
jgi:glycosyltransferase involved in cell wall biosynthesis